MRFNLAKTSPIPSHETKTSVTWQRGPTLNPRIFVVDGRKQDDPDPANIRVGRWSDGRVDSWTSRTRTKAFLLRGRKDEEIRNKKGDPRTTDSMKGSNHMIGRGGGDVSFSRLRLESR